MWAGQGRRHRVHGRLARLAAGATIAGVVLAGGDPASARVTAEGKPGTDGRTVITFTVGGGCEGLPTTVVRLQMPGGMTDVDVRPAPGWEQARLDREAVWSAGSLPDNATATFTIVAKVPGQAGDTVFFPAVQRCGERLVENSLEPLADPAAAGAAPRIVLTTTVEAPPPTMPDGAVVTTTTTTTAPPPTVPAAAEPPVAEPVDTGRIALVVGAGVILAGLVAGALGERARRRRLRLWAVDTPPAPE